MATLFFLLHSTISQSCHSCRTLNLLSAAVSRHLSADCASLLHPVRLQNHLPFSLDPEVPFIHHHHHHQCPDTIVSFTTHSFTASSDTMTSRWSLTALRTLTFSYCAPGNTLIIRSDDPFYTKAVQVPSLEPVLCGSTSRELDPTGTNTCWSTTKNHFGQGLGAEVS